MCTTEQEKIIEERFSKAYAIRFDSDDIDWKKTYNKNRTTGQMTEGKPLAYLNWAVAWRTFKQIYPDGNYRVIETIEGSPLWNINGYGMVKVAVSTSGIEYTETFPIMQGGQNDSMSVDSIDGRDINDAIQRALTKVIARFGVGLYIYEGKLDADSKQPQQSQYREAPQPKATVLKTGDPASAKQVGYIKKILSDKGYTIDGFFKAFGKTPEEMNAGEASKAIDSIRNWPENKPEPKEDPVIQEDELPF